MITALLVLIGVPVWIVVGLVVAAVVSRRRFIAQPDAFALKARGTADGSWPRRPSHGRVVHDVLVEHSGAALVRTTIRGIASVHERPDKQAHAPFLAVFEVAFDDGSIEQIAVQDDDAASLRRLAD